MRQGNLNTSLFYDTPLAVLRSGLLVMPGDEHTTLLFSARFLLMDKTVPPW